MSKVNDGGPAFPMPPYQEQNPVPADGQMHIVSYHTVYQNGMSLRDYFAAAALQGLLSKGVEYQKDAEEFVANLAAACYQFADRLLAERERNK